MSDIILYIIILFLLICIILVFYAYDERFRQLLYTEEVLGSLNINRSEDWAILYSYKNSYYNKYSLNGYFILGFEELNNNTIDIRIVDEFNNQLTNIISISRNGIYNIFFKTIKHTNYITIQYKTTSNLIELFRIEFIEN